MNHNRLQEFDIAKGLAIVLMIIGHCNHFFTYDSRVLTIIYGFHMPLFLFLSGVTLRISEDRRPGATGIGGMIQKKFHSLIVPYFIVGFISILLANPKDVAASVSVLLIGQAANTDMNFNLPLWFLPMLFCSIVLFWASRRCVRNRKLHILVSLLLSAAGGWFVVRRTAFPWSIELALFSQMFLCAGFETSPVICRIFERPLRGKKLLLCLCALAAIPAIYLPSVVYNQRVDMNARLINHPALFILNAVLGIAFMLALVHMIRHAPVLNRAGTFLGTRTMALLCWHIPCANLFYGHVVSRLPEALQRLVWGSQGKPLALLMLLLFVVPVSLILHAVVFSKKQQR